MTPSPNLILEVYICDFFFKITGYFWQKQSPVRAILLFPLFQWYNLQYLPFYFKWNIFVLFLHNCYGSPEFSDCGHLEGTDWTEDLRWANTEPIMHFRETNTDPSVHFRKANTDPSRQFRKANTELLVPVLLPTFLTVSLQSLFPFLLPVVIPNSYTTINTM